MDRLKHLQSVILLIAKDIDKLCQENDIKYYLLGGSAIGAIRHHGFIPWDDDLDIIMDNTNYNKFLEVCEKKLDKDKYYLQVGLRDWPLYFSKVRLLGTELKEIDGDYTDKAEMRGVYVDVFKMDNVPTNNILAHWQYFCAKVYLSYQLATRKYTHSSRKKKFLMAMSAPLKISFVRSFFKNQVEKYNAKETSKLGFFYGRTKYRTSIVEKNILGTPFYVPFENTELPVAEHYHEYLTQMFGDYMTPPPEKDQVGLHILDIDFGKY